MKKAIIIMFLFPSILVAQAVDKIYLKNKEVIKGKIIRVTDINVEIDPEGSKPFLIVKRSNINVIIYSDNTVVNLEDTTDTTAQKLDKKRNKILAGSKFFEIPKVNKTFKTFGYTIDETFELINEFGEIVRVHIDGNFTYNLYLYLNKNWRLTIRKPQIVAKVEYDGRKEIVNILELKDKKNNWRAVKGHIGDYLLYTLDDLSAGDYYLDFSITKVHINKFRIDLNLSPR